MKNAFLVLVAVVSLLHSKTVVQVLEAPDVNISGLSWGNGCLWALSAASGIVYSLDPVSGAVLGSFPFQYTEDIVPTGLAFSEPYQRVLCGGSLGAERWVYQYLPDGTFLQKHAISGG